MWKAWDKPIVPWEDKLFMQKAPWKKLTVGARLANWQPGGTQCPLDG